MTETTLLTAAAVAKLLSVSTTTVYKMASRGQLPPSVKLGRRVRWRSDDVERLMNGTPTESDNKARREALLWKAERLLASLLPELLTNGSAWAPAESEVLPYAAALARIQGYDATVDAGHLMLANLVGGPSCVDTDDLGLDEDDLEALGLGEDDQ